MYYCTAVVLTVVHVLLSTHDIYRLRMEHYMHIRTYIGRYRYTGTVRSTIGKQSRILPSKIGALGRKQYIILLQEQYIVLCVLAALQCKGLKPLSDHGLCIQRDRSAVTRVAELPLTSHDGSIPLFVISTVAILLNCFNAPWQQAAIVMAL